MAIDVAPKVIGIIKASETGDKQQMVDDAMGAFGNCMGVIGQIKGIVGDKLADFSNNVSADAYNDATETYDNLGQLQDSGYRYEKFVSADMLDNASDEAEKLNNLSGDMLKGSATGYASEIKSSDLLSDLKNNGVDDYTPSEKMIEGGISEDTYIENTNNFDDGLLNQINNNMNADYKDARDLMNIGLDGPKNAPESNEYQFISSDFNDNLNKDLNLTGNKTIPKNWDGFVFKDNSTLSYNLSKSSELKSQINNFYNDTNNLSKSQIEVSLNKDTNLFRSIHNATIINPQIDSNGNFTGLLYDKYDYTPQKYGADFFTNAVNNAAAALQGVGNVQRLKNYYVLVPIKLKLENYKL